MNRSVAVQKANYHKLGRLLYLHFDELANATTMFEKVLELDSNNTHACNNMRYILISLNHQFTLERLKHLFDKITKVLGNNFEVYNDFGTMILQKYDERTYARKIFFKALSFNTTDSIRAHALFNLALIDTKNENFTSAVMLMQQAIRLNPRDHIDWYITLAKLLIEKFANYRDAAKFCVDALKMDGDNAKWWHILRGIVYQDKKSVDEMYPLIDNTNNFTIMLEFAIILVERGIGLTAAKSLLTKCIAINSTCSESWFYLGVAQTKLHEYTEAITSLEKSIQLNPEWNAYDALALAYLRTTNNKLKGKALKMIERASQLAPTDLPVRKLASCHSKIAMALALDSQNETQQLKEMYHWEQSISIDPTLRFDDRYDQYAFGLITRGFDIDAAFDTIKQGLKTHSNSDKLLGRLVGMQTMMHNTDNNTLKMFQIAIYQLNTTVAVTYLEYAKYLYYNQLQSQTNDDNKKVQEIETMLYKAINMSSNDSQHSCKDRSYHQIALLKMHMQSISLDKNDESLKIYQQGLNELPNSCLLHVGKAYLLQNENFKQYNQSITIYKKAIALCDNNTNRVEKVNAMFNLASLLIDHNRYQYQLQYKIQQNYSQLQYLIEQGCKELIIGLNGVMFFMLENEWVGNFESTMTKFENTSLIDVHVDKSLIHETLGLYYESIKQYQQSLMQFNMSIHCNHQNNNTNDLIMVSHWKFATISSRFMNNSNTTQIMKHFSIAVNQSSRTTWKYYQLSELFYDFGYFVMNSKLNEVVNATKYYLKSVELNPFNIKARTQLDQIVEQNEDIFSQFDKCTLCMEFMIESFPFIHTNNCTHRFHKNCIDKWYRKQKEKKCVLCSEPQPL